MDAAYSLFAIMLAILLGAMSPGPSFLLVCHTSVSRTRRDGLMAAAGLATGSVVIAALTLLGLKTVLGHAARLDLLLQLLGGAYLVFLGGRLWITATEPVTGLESGATAAQTPFLAGLMTQITNPKTALTYAGVFGALLPLDPPLWLSIVLLPSLFAVETGWYCFVALGFSTDHSRQFYLGRKKWLDRFAGMAIAALGLRLLYGAPYRL
ncbi:MAG: LysE family transporter [Pseudomonadota bacterium]